MIGTCHILKVLHESLRQTATQLCVHRCYVVHTHRALSTAPAFVRLGSKVSSLGCLAASQRHQVASVHCTARSRSSPEDRGKSVSRYQSGTPKPSAAQKVKEAGRDFTYLIVVLLGLGVTGGLLYVVFQELFSSSSPNKVYSRAFDIVKSHPEVIGAFGEPIKCYGETTRRGRRQQVRHTEYMKDGLKHMRVKFYIEGSEPGLKGTVHSESKENAETGKYEFRYIFVDVDTYPRRSIIVEDNR
ncbi:mitochondrial import inner membrane translocase subunit Tim21 [Poecilia reticulata]|uniref:Mitochondrial import inner membrane translocase subunit Tim21 n=1 Tax=Poecilia reticulata TaxID=8081 RepID=A0A3P9PFY3_POERE|nr:PREDICTED: mitochondrial import inner membrane translocase subunit Tim21 [Poecilia reticulata]